MDGVSGLEDGAKSIFNNVVVQRCIVHLIRNSIKYVPSKDYKAFTANLKKIYGAVNLNPNENSLLKHLYLRITELYKKWNGRPQNNWAMVRNQLDIDEKLKERMRKYM